MIESTQGIAGGAKEWAILTDSPLQKTSEQQRKNEKLNEIFETEAS